MRELRLRAYVKNLKWIVPVIRINFDVKTIEVDLSSGQGDLSEYDFNEIELMEYTGFTDKEGNEIYEADIIEYMHNDLEMGAKGMVANWIKKKKVIEYSDVTHSFNVPKGFVNDLKVIGNKFENPELINL